MTRKAWGGGGFPDRFSLYKTPKNLLKLMTNELLLLLSSEPVLLLLVCLGEEPEEEPDMRAAARSSYLAWDSRGSWPKRPKAHGAAVDVGKREKGLEDEDDIYMI